MFNWIFFVALAVGFVARVYDGRIISVALGLTAGVLLSELIRFIVYLIRGLL